MRGTFSKHGYVVEVSESEVYAFARSWPGSSLRDHEGSISFSFEPNGDLVDMNPNDIDGSDVAALSEDAQRWAEKQPGFKSAGLAARFGGLNGRKRQGGRFGGRMKSMTYGVMPSWTEFEAAFDREVPGGTYRIRNDKGGADGDYTARKLYELVKAQARDHELGLDDEAGDFASAVLETLGFEWI
jgi:hypothetical protein